MKTTHLLNRFLASLGLIAAVLAAPVAGAQNDTSTPSADKKKDTEPVRVRFICAVGAHPIKFRLDAAGIAHPYYDEGDIPPEQIFYKEGDGYKRVCLNENSSPGQCVVSADKKGALPTTFYTRKIASAAPGTDAKSKGKTTDEYTPLLTINGLGGKLKDALVCLHNPNLAGKWCPPKTTVLDASPAVVPPGTVLVVNLSAKTTAMQIGAAKPVTLKPGAHATISPGTPANAKILFKMAVANAKGVFAKSGEYTYQAQPESRQVLTLYGVDEKVTPAGVEWFIGAL